MGHYLGRIKVQVARACFLTIQRLTRILSFNDLEQHPNAKECLNKIETQDGDAESEVRGAIR